MARFQTRRGRVGPWELSPADHTRGLGATGFGFPGLPEGRARLLKMLGISLLVHAVLSPVPLLLGLGTLLPLVKPPDAELAPEPELDAIPVDLLGEEPAPDPEEPTPVEPASPPEPAAPLPPEPEATQPATSPPVPDSKQEGAPAPAEQKPSTPDAFGDPVALAGAAGKLADSNANVRLMIYSSVIRQHQLGPRIGGLLRRTPQWQDFFGPAGVDPVLDVDQVLIAGPEMRDSSNVVAVVAHHLPEELVQGALSRLVERSGEWLRTDPPLARARADRAERLFAAPRPGIVAVAPPSAEKSMRSLGSKLRFPAGPEGVALQAFIVRPHRPVAALGLKIPKSLEWLRAEVLPAEAGGARIRLLLQDESPESARTHAQELQERLRAAAEVDFTRMGTAGAALSFLFGGSRRKMVERIDLYAEKDQIRGLIELTSEQLLTIADLLDAVLPPAMDSSPKRRGGLEPGPTEPSPTEPSPAEPSPTEPSPTEPSPTEPSPTEPSPTEPGSGKPTEQLRQELPDEAPSGSAREGHGPAEAPSGLPQ